MINYTILNAESFDDVEIDSFWSVGKAKESKMHRIHAYPAKFPAFITNKAIEHAKSKNIEINCIADVFCGCGTTAYESHKNDIAFWGCDINPVATLIAQVKSKKYQRARLQKYYRSILLSYKRSKTQHMYDQANERLQYWYSKDQYNELYKLKRSIERMTPSKSHYRMFFLCAFSNILKPTSRWLTKSIKPQVDPYKTPANVLDAFNVQCNYMVAANDDCENNNSAEVEIVTANILSSDIHMPNVDLIVTSPPYVTSYEYADLHQLSSLWLGYVDDYTTLRDGSIGSVHHMYNFERELKRLNVVGGKVVFQLIDQFRSKAKAVAKYYLDMQRVAEVCYEKLRYQGVAVFVIGNTEYKGVRIRNAEHLAESLKAAGFDHIAVTKRKISNKILTPFRDDVGRFTTDSSGRKVYSDEFIIMGQKL